MKAVVFGATISAKAVYKEIEKKYSIIAYCDNDMSKWGGIWKGTYHKSR